MIDTEQRLKGAALRLADRSNHRLPAAAMERAIDAAGRNGLVLGGEQKAALAHIVRPRNLAMVTGYAGTGNSAMLGVAREAWEGAGYAVQGLAPSGIAAPNLESGSGNASRTIWTIEHHWEKGRDLIKLRTASDRERGVK